MVRFLRALYRCMDYRAEHLEETAALHVKFLVNYLGSLRNAKKDR